MTARASGEPHAGRWVAWYSYVDHDRRVYLRRFHDDGGTSWTVVRQDAIRFDKKGEAERIVRELRPRIPGQHTGAEKIGWDGPW